MVNFSSIKSLAFAGTIALLAALTTTANAKAADDDCSMAIKSSTVTGAAVIVSSSSIRNVSGKAEYYYCFTKKADDKKKWKIAYTSDYKEVNGGSIEFIVPVAELSKGKTGYLSLRADTLETILNNAIICTEAPKIKASIDSEKFSASGASIVLENKDKTPITTGRIEVSSQYGSFHLEANVADLENGTEEKVFKFLDNIATQGGGTLNLIYYADNVTPAATVKLKVPPAANSPKISLKLAKSFDFKPKNTIAYRVNRIVLNELGKKYKYIYGPWTVNESGKAVTAESLFGDSYTEKDLSGSTILTETMNFEVKTIGKKGKLDSLVNTQDIYKSPDALDPVQNITIDKITKTTGKEDNATKVIDSISISINNLYKINTINEKVLKYKSDNGKWTNVKDNKITFKSNKIPEELYIRIKGVDYKYKIINGVWAGTFFEMPGRAVKITNLKTNDPENDALYATSAAIVAVTKGAVNYH